MHIPHDIWYHIANFIPDAILGDLYQVNSSFFNIAMGIRYSKVTVHDLGEAKTKRQLLRLKWVLLAATLRDSSQLSTRLNTRDPFVAQRVRHLNLYLESNYEFFLNWDHRSKRSRWRRIIDKVTRKPKGPRCALEEVIQDLTEFVSGLPNVVELHVCARELRLHEESGPVFAAAWKTFGAKLRKISLQGSIECFRHPLSITEFSQLRELQLEFTDFSCTFTAPQLNTFMCDTVAPAVDRLSPVLENLSLSFGLYTWGHLDISDFLKALGPMPRLNALDVHIPPHKLGDPAGLIRILHDHSGSLRHVKLRLDCHNWMREPHSEHRLRSLMSKLLSDKAIFVNLQSFEFSPTIPNLNGFDLVTRYMMRSADTLTSLTIIDRFLTYEEVAIIASIFFHRPAESSLRTLVVNVQFFGPRLLTLLATTLPGLKRLSLCTFNWGVEDFVMSDPIMFLKLSAFRTEMMSYKDVFMRWSLRDLTVMLGGGHSPPHWPRNIPVGVVQVLLDCIPSMQNFWGVGKMSCGSRFRRCVRCEGEGCWLSPGCVIVH